MKIFKMADEKSTPMWAFDSEKNQEKGDISMDKIERLNITASSEVSDQTLMVECDHIEHCANNNKTYHYNISWNKSHIDHLREYATVCGLKESQFKAVDPKPYTEKHILSSCDSPNIRTASIGNKSKIDLGDPFHLEERSDMSHMDKTNWENVKKQANMKEAPVMLNGNIVPIRGGEDYFKNSDVNPAKNQNSITNPDAIGKLATSVEEDTGARLKRQIKEKEDVRKSAHDQWQKDVVKAMEHKDIVPKGAVFPTESLNANTGLNTPASKMGVYAKFDPASIPEKTSGELIKEKNAEYRKSINPRTEKAKAEFEMSHQASRMINDTFAEQLKKYIK